MRIAHVLSSFEIGGAEVIAIELAAAQRAAGHDVTMLAARDGPLRDRCVSLGVPAHPFSGRSVGLGAEVIRFFLRHRFGLINSHNPSAHRLARLSRAAGWPPLVLTLHGQPSRTYGSLTGPLSTDGVIAVSRSTRATFLERHHRFDRRRIIVIPNGVSDPDHRDGDPLARLRKPGHIVVFVAARLDPIKDLSLLLRAVAALGPDRPVQLVIAGDGPDRDKLEELGRHLGLGDRLSMLGFRDDVRQLYPAADIFALSSRSEAMPIAVLEAMAAGLPVVAPAVGGIGEVVDDGRTGLIVSPGDIVALSGAIARLAGDAALRQAMGAAGRVHALTQFSLSTMTRRYLQAYQALAAVGPFGRHRAWERSGLC
ncbi:MAG: glycosyltransferase family 4 protein [Gemmatimonadales bacterium]